MTPSGKTKLTIDVDAQMKQDFKIYCVQNGTTMTDEVTNFIQSRLDADKKRKGKK